eukprot:CRZ01486.1 hypothetical protein [Spongospora subterranea]
MRVRSTCASAVHSHFNSRGFQWIHAPIITASDCEGAGEQFQVVTTSGRDPTSFFGTNAFLTVSAQLHAEMFACSMGPVYTFGPTFRSENSHTTRHLAEFWMVEPEIPFATLDVLMDEAEKLVKTCVRTCIGTHDDDLRLLWSDSSSLRLKAAEATGQSASIARDPALSAEDNYASYSSIITSCRDEVFARISYSDAIQILQECPMAPQFSHVPVWGDDLKSEHEQYLATVHFKRPLFVTHYPAKLKPFYMKRSSSGAKATCAAMDLLMPCIGEVVGGSERIDNVEDLSESMASHGLDSSKMSWYLDLRR